MLAANRYSLRIVLLLLSYCAFTARGQQKVAEDRCGTMAAQEAAFKRNPALKARFENSVQQLKQITDRTTANQSVLREEGAPIYIPVVFHIVLNSTTMGNVTDAMIKAQLDTLNVDYAGLNADSTKIPAAFKPLFGKSLIQFKLAQRTPDDDPSTGIERYTTTKASYSSDDNTLKYKSSGGADAWDPNRYFNVWVTNISGGILGYATFPQGSVQEEQGVVVQYSSLPGGTLVPYNLGRTLTHESGHFFFLYHIWGDDNGACTGTDYIGDTPNQARQTGGCPNGEVRLDACSIAAPGIMYQNYMDYTDDACMVMFTLQQAARMEAALNTYRPTLLTSNAADPVVLKNINASLRSINAPANRICATSFTPSVTLRNLGALTLTTANIYASIDDGAPVKTQWTGALASRAAINVVLNSLTAAAGRHTLKIYVADPNGSVDGEPSNDTVRSSFEYYPPVAPPYTESFESTTFPPQGWDIVNPDGYYTWERVTGVAKTGNASVVIRNLDYAQNGQVDYLRLPLVNIVQADSAFLTFQVAAAVQTDPLTANNVWDTLQVLISTDCGNTYTSLYKKWGGSLITRKTPVTTSFVPAANEWRKDSVNITGYIDKGPVMLAFLNTTNYENNIYLDDINVYKIYINPNLKANGILITPNPTGGTLSVQFYPNPVTLKGISIYDMNGARIMERQIGGYNGTNRYDFDLSRYANGMYTVRIVYSDKTVVQKVLKVK
jgi:hypothetical protein